MDGALVIDKPSGPTSHDVVARVRRVLGERRIGHTGTLDPLASGLLLLVVGRATRLARFLSASDKSYDAEIRLGVATDTYDAQGAPTTAPYVGPMPSSADVERGLDAFRGTFLQQPPAYSAKKIGGQRSYKLARASRAAAGRPAAVPAAPATPAPPSFPAPDPVTVTAHAIVVTACDGDTVRLRVDCSTGFYIRSLAHDLGRRLGTGAHLTALRRTRSGAFTLASALTLETLERTPSVVAAALIPLSDMLPDLAAVALTPEGVAHALHGRDVGPLEITSVTSGFGIWDSGFDGRQTGPGSFESQIPNPKSLPPVRLLDPTGDLVALAEPVGHTGLLHPSVVLR
jgi:tRNA pseudouridine55 synthase